IKELSDVLIYKSITPEKQAPAFQTPPRGTHPHLWDTTSVRLLSVLAISGGLLGKPQKYGGGAPERTSPAPINRDVSLKRVLGCCDATSATGYGLTLGVPARCRAWYRSSVSGANARRHSIAASPSTPPPTGSAPGRARDSCAGRAAGGCRRRRRSRPKGWQGGPPATASTAPTKDQGLAASAGLRAKTCQGDFRENNS